MRDSAMLEQQLLPRFREAIRAASCHEEPAEAMPRAKTDRHTKSLLLYLFSGTRGGFTRLRMVMLLLERPRNTHQLALEMGLDYKAVKHHTRVMEKNSMLARTGGGYGACLHLSNLLEHNVCALEEVIDVLERKRRSKKKTYI